MDWSEIKKKQEWRNKQTGRISIVETEPEKQYDDIRLLHSSGIRTFINSGMMLSRYELVTPKP